ncbi:MAG: hypothetical protein ACLQU2_11825 [Candidatus Binataceae bacterium]
MLHHADSSRTGVEITEGSTPEHHRKLINNEREIDNHYELEPGSMGDEQERLWALLMLEAIKRKAAKLAGGDWNPADAHDLVLYDNGPAFVLYPSQARHMLRELLSVSPGTGFRTVSIITAGASQLIHDVEGTFRVLRIAPT